MKETNFFWGLGRRKTAVARTRVMSGSGKIMINDRDLETYCYTEELVRVALAPLVTVGLRNSIDVHVNVNGGGPNGQSGAIALGIARALQRMNPELRKTLKTAGHLKRDPRMRERKKVGQPGARKRFQFSKR